MLNDDITVIKESQAHVIKELREGGSSPTLQNVIGLIDLLIAEDRASNDEATTEAFLSNQGSVRRLKYLKTLLTFSK